MKRPLILVLLIVLAAGAFLGLALLGRKRRQADPAVSLRIPVAVNPSSLDPVKIVDVYESGVAERIFSTLVRHGPKLEILPDLAASWQVSEDGKTYTFKLRPDVRFHNNRLMVAADVVWSLNRLADPRVSRKMELVEEIAGVRERIDAYRALMAKRPKGQALTAEDKRELAKLLDLSALPGLSAPDTGTVVVKLRRPWPPFLHLLAMVPTAVVPREEVEKSGRAFGRRPAGTGPFRFVEWQENDRVFLERFEAYFGGKPRLEAVEYQIIKEPAMALQKYEKGDLDVCEVPSSKMNQIRGRSDHHRWSQLTTSYLGISMLKEPCGKNVHLRRALNYAVDRERLCKVVLQGKGVPAKGILPPGMPGYRSEMKGYSYDPEATKRELAAAGHPGGKGLKPIPLYYRADRDGQRIVKELDQQYRTAGIPVELRAVEWTYLKTLTRKDPPALFRIAWIADYPDPDNFLYVLFHGARAGQTNRVHYRSPKADAALDAARSMPAGPERLAAYGRAEELITGEAPWVFLYHQSADLLVKPNVKGLEFTPLDSGADLMKADFTGVYKE